MDGPVVGRLETSNFRGFNEHHVLYGKHLGGNVTGVHDVFVTFDGSPNYQLCMDNCWANQTSSCEEVAKDGCGDGIGNFDWFHLDTACPSESPYLDGNKCVAACPTGCSTNNECSACVATKPEVATKLVNVRCIRPTQIRVGMKIYCGGQLFPADHEVLYGSAPGFNQSPASGPGVGALVTSPDRWVTRINGVATKLIEQNTLLPVPTNALGTYTVEFEFLGQDDLLPAKASTTYTVDVP